MKIETRALTDKRAGLKVETRADGTRHVCGYAAVFYNGTPETQFELWQGCVERIMPGAFTEALSRDDVRCLFNHEADAIFGRTVAGTLTLTEDSVGLWYDCVLSNSGAADNLYTSVDRRDVTGSSFGFECEKSDWITAKTGEGISYDVRQVMSVKLWDVGPATFPAYAGTSSEIATRSHDAWRETEKLKERRDRFSQLKRTHLLDSARRVLKSQ